MKKIKKITKSKTTKKTKPQGAPPPRRVAGAAVDVRFPDMDGVINDIMAVNDGLYAGTIQVDQARALHSGFKQVMKAIAEEIALAKYMGRVDSVAKRWFKRIEQSTVSSDRSAGAADDLTRRLDRLEVLMTQRPTRGGKTAQA